ncbi:MAG: hypothetical protein KGI97_06515 [Alphaproteobacteria bacterium]|nr:hypothetical protein [Alphaproteobacteria bacterium]
MTDVDAIVAEIAKKQLRIETLETRNADSLDFHEVSVWGLRTALLCAFEAGRKAARTKPRVIETGKKDTTYRATIEASYQGLIEVWGEPGKGDSYKTEAEWVVRPAGKWVITIYNYKNSRAYADKYPEITAVREWHIGGHSADIVDRLLEMMAGRAKLIHRAD